ncbi:MAG: C25 family cysteine peptidase, partial [Candidatus Methylomirabilales bacterium]
ELRQSQGLVTRAVSLEEVFAQFGHGETSPLAIKEFLEYAYQFWADPSPRYVLLLGDASYDPKDHLKTGFKDWVPGFPVKTSFLWTVSDPAYAAVNGEDLLPDLALGRLPAGSVEEAQRLIQKVLAFEHGGGNFDGSAVLVADNADLAGNFEQDAEEIANTLLARRNPRKIYYSQQGANSRTKIREAFDEGASLMSYVGHGSTVVWAGENIFNYQDVNTLASQPQQPLLLTLNCLNGFFHLPSLNSLSEAFLKAEGKGAIAAFSPSGLSVNDAAHRFHKALLQEILSGRHERLGDAVLAAQKTYVDSGAFPELLSIYHLFADPALGLR